MASSSDMSKEPPLYKPGALNNISEFLHNNSERPAPSANMSYSPARANPEYTALSNDKDNKYKELLEQAKKDSAPIVMKNVTFLIPLLKGIDITDDRVKQLIDIQLKNYLSNILKSELASYRTHILARDDLDSADINYLTEMNKHKLLLDMVYRLNEIAKTDTANTEIQQIVRDIRESIKKYYGGKRRTRYRNKRKAKKTRKSRNRR